MFTVGDKIRIINLQDPYADRYIGKEGIITKISDCLGSLRLDGTWCSIGIFPYDGDSVEIIERKIDFS